MDEWLKRPSTLDGWLIAKESISTQQTQQIDPPESSSMQLDSTFDLFLSEEILSQIVNLTNQSYERFVAKRTCTFEKNYRLVSDRHTRVEDLFGSYSYDRH